MLALALFFQLPSFWLLVRRPFRIPALTRAVLAACAVCCDRIGDGNHFVEFDFNAIESRSSEPLVHITDSALLWNDSEHSAHCTFARFVRSVRLKLDSCTICSCLFGTGTSCLVT
jgi:hypothetical protein